MASAIYPTAKAQFLQGGINMNTGVIRAVLIDTGTYTYNTAHDAYNDLTGIVGTESPAFTTKTFVNGLFDADDITFTAVSGATIEAVVIFLDTGVAANDLLIAYIDGLSATPNSGNIVVTWSASGIMQL